MEFNNLTFAMIKPDAVAHNNTGKIIDIIEKNNFEIIRLHKAILAKDLAEEFYAVHKDRPFYGELVEFVTSGPVVIMALHKENAVAEWRNLIGATNPKDAAPGTIRHEFGTSIDKNAVHGSDSSETAAQEIELFFPEMFDFPEEENDEDENDKNDESEDKEIESDTCCG
jgi:nucleoside-diphosphate kinase